MKFKKLSFKNKNSQALSARIEFPLDEKPIAFALFAHCFTCGKDLVASRNISRTLTSNGIAVMLFDFTGLGDSEGDFESSDFSGNISDLLAASDFLKEHYEAPKILIGHSLGGAAALFTAAQMPTIEAVVTIAAPFNPYHLTKMIAKDLDKIEEKGEAKVSIGGRPFTIKKSFIDDLGTHNAEKIARELRKPLLIFHSPQDETVNIDNAAKIYIAAHHPKSFISLDGANHLISDKRDSEYVGNVIAGWVRRYIKTEDKKENPPPQQSNPPVRSFSSYEHSIKGESYMYESWTSSKSEFAVTAVRIDPNGNHSKVYFSSDLSQIVSKISRSDVTNSRMQYNWEFHSPDWQPWYNSWAPNTVQIGKNYVFWNTFERDWNRSRKWLGSASRNGTNFSLWGKCKYSSEWYTWIPNTLSVHHTQFVWIDYYWSHWNNSWKADFRLWKVYI